LIVTIVAAADFSENESWKILHKMCVLIYLPSITCELEVWNAEEHGHDDVTLSYDQCLVTFWTNASSLNQPEKDILSFKANQPSGSKP
jgi:hypothetical protein